MTSDRCPSCAASVRPGSPWCTLCWADLRPKPAPPPPPAPAPAPVPAAGVPGAAPYAGVPGAAPYAAVPGAPVTATLAPVDPLTAPLGAVLGHPVAAEPAAAAAPATPAVTWPCVECGAQNDLDLSTCGVCTAPFGGRIARLDDVKGARRRYMVIGFGVVAVFLMMLAVVTFAGTNATTVDGGGDGGDVPLETTVDYSNLPQG